jgi:Tol biopolymer transport system component/ligand-binding sensor domain-containing protein
VRRLIFFEDGEYCFYRVSDEGASVSIDNVPLELPHNEDNWKEPVSGCREFTAGEHNIRVDLTNLQDDGQSVIELWYEGPGVQPPKGAMSGDWQAHFFATPDLIGDPIWSTHLPGPTLDFTTTTEDVIPVVNFGAIFSRTFTLTETGYYRFDLDVDDGARFEICGNEVLDEFHWGPATYTVERYLEAGDHTLRLDYYESHEDQHLALEWHKIAAPTPPIQRILFASDRDGDYDVYAMDINGANPVNLTDNTAGERDPAWSPDGRRIVFASDREGTWQIYVMDADGSDVHSLGVTGFQPRWSPDGSRIVFMAGPEWAWEIYVMDADGTNIVQLTDNEVADFTPSWSPDGSRILFETGRDAPDRQQEIYVMNADGSEPVNLSQHLAWDGSPAWSPDGETIAFFSDRDGNNEIYLMNADGSNQRRLTSSDELKDEFPTWSPDGRFLAFEESNQIYRHDVDGADPRVALTDHPAEHDRPHWSPPGYGYVFENLTDGDDVHEHALVVAGDYVWTGGDGGLTRWNREEPEQQKKFTSEDGLAENSIHALLAENASSLWIGTGGWPFSGSGLSHYDFDDGRDRWRTFTADDGLGSNTVFDLYQDSQGKIWAGTTNGVRIYEGARWRGFAEMEDIWVRSLFEASDGAFWFGTSGDGVVRYDPAASDEGAWQWFNPMVLSQADDEGYRYVLDVIENPPGELWFATHGGVVYHDFAGSGAWQVLTGTLGVWTYAAERDRDGALWFGTDRGVVRRDAEGEHTYTVEDSITDDIRALHLDDAGVLWAAGNGLYRYDREHDQWQDFYTHDDQVYNHVSAILEDREGAFWLAHSIFMDYASFDGVTRHTPANGDWQHFDSENGWGNDSDSVHAILQDRDGILWFGFDRDGGGVCRYDLDKDEWLPCYRADANGLVTDTVDAIAETPDGALWFGTSGGGLSRFDNERWETFTEHNSDLLSDEIHCLATDNEGSLWITTDQGVNRFFYETGEWVPFTTGNSDLIADEVLSLALHDSDGVWFGTQAGLSHYNLMDRKWRNFEGTPALASWVNNCSQTLHVDRYGSVWVGTDEGLYRSTPEGGWVHLTTANGLASNHVLAIFEDSEGTFWIGTPGGISSVTIEK